MNILKPYLLLLTCLSLLLFFSTCKKYPENTLWFKSPASIEFIEGNLTHYIVNGIDSINELDNFFYNDVNNNPYVGDFSSLKFQTRPTRAKGYYEAFINKPQNYNGYFSNNFEYRYIDKNNKIKLSNTIDIKRVIKKNIFIDDSIIWEITMLEKKNGTRKMKGTYNGNTYELQFN